MPCALQVTFSVVQTPPTLKTVELLRTSGSGTIAPSLARSILAMLHLETVQRVRCNDGAAHLWEQATFDRCAV